MEKRDYALMNTFEDDYDFTLLRSLEKEALLSMLFAFKYLSKCDSFTHDLLVVSACGSLKNSNDSIYLTFRDMYFCTTCM